MRKLTYNQSIGVAVALVVIGFLLFGANLWGFFTTTTNNAGAPSTDALTAANATNVTNTTMEIPTTGVKTEDIIVGTGPVAKSGQSVTVNYVGMLTDGKVFDSSYDRGQPFSFALGAGQVIRGWDEGLVGMKVGGKRRLFIAPDYGYGSQGAAPVIPPNAVLVFDVELLNVK